MTKTRKTARNLVLAAAALLTLGAASVATSTDASAFGRGGFHGGFHGGYHGGFHGGFRHFGHYGYRWNHYRFGWNRFGYRPYFHSYRYGWRWNHCYYFRNCGFRPGPIISGGPGPVGSGAPTASMAPMMQVAATPKPACLLKQYGPDGAVMFMDRCTQESAISPPPGAQGPGPQGPAQQQ